MGMGEEVSTMADALCWLGLSFLLAVPALTSVAYAEVVGAILLILGTVGKIISALKSS